MVSSEEFIKTWQKASSPKEVAAAFGRADSRGVSSRASTMRALGIPLKKFPSGHQGPRLNIEALTELAESLE